MYSCKPLFLISIFLTILFGCGDQIDVLDKTTNTSWIQKKFQINYDGIKREYILYKPKSYSENSPLLFMLHGFGSNMNIILSYSKMNDLADKNGFMVCYPQGSTLWTGKTHWNANLEMSNVNDIEFLSFLALKIQEEYKTSLDNIFISGMSNGGFMSYTLGCEKSDIFKGVASITGTMSGYDWRNCSPSSRIPILQISGTSDNIVPWDGTMNPAYGWGGAPHILEVMGFWSDLNACSEEEVFNFPDVDKSDYSTVSLTKKKGGRFNNEVWFYKVSGGGHDWPGVWGNKDINASDEIWKFFKQHLK